MILYNLNLLLRFRELVIYMVSVEDLVESPTHTSESYFPHRLLDKGTTSKIIEPTYSNGSGDLSLLCLSHPGTIATKSSRRGILKGLASLIKNNPNYEFDAVLITGAMPYIPYKSTKERDPYLAYLKDGLDDLGEKQIEQLTPDEIEELKLHSGISMLSDAMEYLRAEFEPLKKVIKNKPIIYVHSLTDEMNIEELIDKRKAGETTAKAMEHEIVALKGKIKDIKDDMKLTRDERTVYVKQIKSYGTQVDQLQRILGITLDKHDLVQEQLEKIDSRVLPNRGAAEGFIYKEIFPDMSREEVRENLGYKGRLRKKDIPKVYRRISKILGEQIKELKTESRSFRSMQGYDRKTIRSIHDRVSVLDSELLETERNIGLRRKFLKRLVFEKERAPRTSAEVKRLKAETREEYNEQYIKKILDGSVGELYIVDSQIATMKFGDKKVAFAYTYNPQSKIPLVSSFLRRNNMERSFNLMGLEDRVDMSIEGGHHLTGLAGVARRVERDSDRVTMNIRLPGLYDLELLKEVGEKEKLNVWDYKRLVKAGQGNLLLGVGASICSLMGDGSQEYKFIGLGDLLKISELENDVEWLGSEKDNIMSHNLEKLPVAEYLHLRIIEKNIELKQRLGVEIRKKEKYLKGQNKIFEEIEEKISEFDQTEDGKEIEKLEREKIIIDERRKSVDESIRKTDKEISSIDKLVESDLDVVPDKGQYFVAKVDVIDKKVALTRSWDLRAGLLDLKSKLDIYQKAEIKPDLIMDYLEDSLKEVNARLSYHRDPDMVEIDKEADLHIGAATSDGTIIGSRKLTPEQLLEAWRIRLEHLKISPDVIVNMGDNVQGNPVRGAFSGVMSRRRPSEVIEEGREFYLKLKGILGKRGKKGSELLKKLEEGKDVSSAVKRYLIDSEELIPLIGEAEKVIGGSGSFMRSWSIVNQSLQEDELLKILTGHYGRMLEDGADLILVSGGHSVYGNQGNTNEALDIRAALDPSGQYRDKIHPMIGIKSGGGYIDLRGIRFSGVHETRKTGDVALSATTSLVTANIGIDSFGDSDVRIWSHDTAHSHRFGFNVCGGMKTLVVVSAQAGLQDEIPGLLWTKKGTASARGFSYVYVPDRVAQEKKGLKDEVIGRAVIKFFPEGSLKPFAPTYTSVPDVGIS